MVTTAAFAPGDRVRIPNPEGGYDIGRFDAYLTPHLAERR